MLNLYAVMLGGHTEHCNIELHDVVFVVGHSLEELYPTLVNKWFGGINKSIHIDASVELKYVDGHEIIITQESEPLINKKTLYFANFGGYKSNFFGELHEINFYVASSRIEALARAKKDLCLGMHQQHSDDHLIIDDLIAIDHIAPYSIQLVPTEQPCELKIDAFYRKLNFPNVLEKAKELRNEQSQ